MPRADCAAAIWPASRLANCRPLGAVGCHFHSQMCMVASCRQLKTSL
jgi:hypothetical protein